jgi:hypothetical protein
LRTLSTGAGVSGVPSGSSPKGAGFLGAPLESLPIKIGVSGAPLSSSNDLVNNDAKMKDNELLSENEKLRKENERMKLEILEFKRSVSLPLPIPIPICIPTTARIGQIIGNAVPENEDEEVPINAANSIRKRKYAKSPPINTLTVSLSSKKQINDNNYIGNYDPFDFHDCHSNDEIIENEGKKSNINSNLSAPSLSPPTSSMKVNGKNQKSQSKSPNSKSSKQFDLKLGKKSPISSQITSPSKSPILSQNGVKAKMKISPKKKNENAEEKGVRVQKEVENKVEKRKKEDIRKVFTHILPYPEDDNLPLNNYHISYFEPSPN